MGDASLWDCYTSGRLRDADQRYLLNTILLPRGACLCLLRSSIIVFGVCGSHRLCQYSTRHHVGRRNGGPVHDNSPLQLYSQRALGLRKAQYDS